MAGDSVYWEEYYKDNKKKINRKRKKKYHTDEEYRQSVLQASRDFRARKRKEREEQGPQVRSPRHQTPIKKKIRGGHVVNFWSVGYFALILGRSVQSIGYWEKEKKTKSPLLPVTPYRDSRGFRYYTIEMMTTVKKIVGDKKRMFPADRQIYDEIKEAWRKLGVPVDLKVAKRDEKKRMSMALAATRLPKT
jgi:hypothetical protein